MAVWLLYNMEKNAILIDEQAEELKSELEMIVPDMTHYSRLAQKLKPVC